MNWKGPCEEHDTALEDFLKHDNLDPRVTLGMQRVPFWFEGASSPNKKIIRAYSA